jgi:hypothetical protein
VLVKAEVPPVVEKGAPPVVEKGAPPVVEEEAPPVDGTEVSVEVNMGVVKTAGKLSLVSWVLE